MYVCIYVYAYTYIYIYTHTYMYVSLSLSLSIYIYIYNYIHICTLYMIHMCVCIYIYMYIHTDPRELRPICGMRGPGKVGARPEPILMFEGWDSPGEREVPEFHLGFLLVWILTR